MMDTARMQLSVIDYAMSQSTFMDGTAVPVNRLANAMSGHRFRQLVDEHPEWSDLHLQGEGEPLLVPQLGDMIRYASTKGLLVTLDTNASLLYRDRAAELVEAGLDRMRVFLDGQRPNAEHRETGKLPVDFFGSPILENLAGLAAEVREQRSGLVTRVVYRLDRRTTPLLVDTVALLASVWVTRVRVELARPVPLIVRNEVMAKAFETAEEHGMSLTFGGTEFDHRPYWTVDGDLRTWREQRLEHLLDLRQRTETKDDLRRRLLASTGE